MSDETSEDALRKVREQREADLVRLRIAELHENPVQGNFDAAHLKAVHARIFQDLPEHQPAVVRADSDGWNKARELEGQGPSHVVRYAHEGVEVRIEGILQNFGGPDAIKGLTTDDAAARLAKLYGDLDHAHGFYEGNSRTLREFTRELASEAGHTLDWARTAVSAEQRNALYVARDVAVLERAYPGLTEERAMTTNDRTEYEAWWHLENLRGLQGDTTLESIIRHGMTPHRSAEAALNNPDHHSPEDGTRAYLNAALGLDQADCSEAPVPGDGKEASVASAYLARVLSGDSKAERDAGQQEAEQAQGIGIAPADDGGRDMD